MNEGCCNLECVAKTIGWLQVASCVFVMLMEVVNVWTLIETDIPPVNQVVIEQLDNNITVVEVNEETIRKHEADEAARHIGIIAGILVILFYFFLVSLAGALLTGIRKRKPTLIRVWLVANALGCSFVAGVILIELGAMLIASDPGSLTKQIIWLVLNLLQVWVIYVYYEETKDQLQSSC